MHESLKKRLKTAIFSAIYSVVFGMALFSRLSPSGRQIAP
jgi:hypothetical protein